MQSAAWITSKKNTSLPQGASGALSLARCGSCAAPLAPSDASPETTGYHRLTLRLWELVHVQVAAVKRAYNPFFEMNDLFFFLLPALEMNLDQRLKLHQVLLHPLTMYVL